MSRSVHVARPGGSIAAGTRAMGHAADVVSEHPVAGHLIRLGYIVRGIIYFLPGVLALRMAFVAPDGGGGAIAPSGALELIAQQPLGRLLMIPIAVGLAGYSMWGVVRALLDPLHRGNSIKGIGARLGYLSSAAAYAGFLVATCNFIFGALSHIPAGRDWTAELLARPSGRWMVGLFGLGWIAGAGIAQIVIGWSGSFEKDLRRESMSSSEFWWAVRLGRVGHVARGGVFTIIGILILAAALYAGPQQSHGMDGALLALLKQPYGRILLVFVAMGLIAFAAYSGMCARWMRLPSREPLGNEQPYRPHPSSL